MSRRATTTRARARGSGCSRRGLYCVFAIDRRALALAAAPTPYGRHIHCVAAVALLRLQARGVARIGLVRMSGTSSGTGRALQDALNALLMLGVILPPALLTAQLRHICPSTQDVHLRTARDLDSTWAGTLERVVQQVRHEGGPSEAMLCELYLEQPLLLINLVYFVVVDVGFYLIYLLQSSTWLIDPHWQLIPMSIAAFWVSHPHATPNDAVHPRALLALGLVYLWGFRLLHNCKCHSRPD